MAASVLVVGAGAIGALYAGVLARAGCEVSVVARSDYDAVSRDGYRIESGMGDLSFRPERVLRAAEGDHDYVLVALKLVRGVDPAALIRAAVGPKTVIVFVANGIDVEPALKEQFPSSEFVSGVAYAAASREGPGHIRHHTTFTRLVLGRYPGGASDAAARFAALIKQGGASVRVTEDIVGARWQKCAWNTVFNPVSALGGGLGTKAILAAPESVALVRAAIEEVCAVARAAGHPLPENTAEEQVSGTQRMPDHLSSMAQDLVAGRPLETEPLLGNVVRAAARLSVPVPRLEALYALMRMLESRRVH